MLAQRAFGEKVREVGKSFVVFFFGERSLDLLSEWARAPYTVCVDFMG